MEEQDSLCLPYIAIDKHKMIDLVEGFRGGSGRSGGGRSGGSRSSGGRSSGSRSSGISHGVGNIGGRSGGSVRGSSGGISHGVGTRRGSSGGLTTSPRPSRTPTSPKFTNPNLISRAGYAHRNRDRHRHRDRTWYGGDYSRRGWWWPWGYDWYGWYNWPYNWPYSWYDGWSYGDDYIYDPIIVDDVLINEPETTVTEKPVQEQQIVQPPNLQNYFIMFGIIFIIIMLIVIMFRS